MKQMFRLTALASVAAIALVGGPIASASAHDEHPEGINHAVFVQTDNPAGNQIVAYDRADDGTLKLDHRYDTGGNGAQAAMAPVDPLASQGSLVYDPGHARLYAVNAGSDTLSVFAVAGDRLSLRQVVPSGGEFPASIAVRGRLVYVLNAGGKGSVKGYRVDEGRLDPLERSTRSLGLSNANPPNFLTSPGQVGFSPEGDRLIVTTKASTSDIDVFDVRPDGRLSESPVVNASSTPVPYGFTFDPAGRLVVSEAATSTVTTYTVHGNGSLTALASLSDHQTAACWITSASGNYYVANSGSANISGYHIDGSGNLTLLTPTGIVATTDGGPIDMAAARNGKFLYAETGATGIVDEFHVESDGTLTKIGTVTGFGNLGLEGIVAA